MKDFLIKLPLKTEAIKSGLINEKDYDKIVNPKKMIYPEQILKKLLTKFLELSANKSIDCKIL